MKTDFELGKFYRDSNYGAVEIIYTTLDRRIGSFVTPLIGILRMHGRSEQIYFYDAQGRITDDGESSRNLIPFAVPVDELYDFQRGVTK